MEAEGVEAEWEAKRMGGQKNGRPREREAQSGRQEWKLSGRQKEWEADIMEAKRVEVL